MWVYYWNVRFWPYSCYPTIFEGNSSCWYAGTCRCALLYWPTRRNWTSEQSV